MLKYILFVLIFSNALFPQKSTDISLKILNKVVKNDHDVIFIIKNNSAKNYRMLLDTLFFADTQYDSEYFLNPYFTLSDSDGEEVVKVTKIVERSSSNKQPESLSLLKICAGKSLKFKIPFQINRRIDNKVSTLFYVNRKRKYYVQIKYNLRSDFLTLKYVKNKINFNENNKLEIYSGTLISNKVPVIFKD